VTTTTPDVAAYEAPRLTPRFSTFDGIRALAATLVLLHHAGFHSGANYTSWWAPYLSRMDIGVPIFFVISGFLIYRPFVARQFAGADLPGTAGFYRRRVVRIFPGYWAAYLIQLALGAITVAGLGSFVFSFFLIHVYQPDWVVKGITQSWSLATELGFYLLLPAWAWLGLRLTRGRTINEQAMLLLAGCGSLFLLSFAFRASMEAISPVAEEGWGSASRYWIFSLCDIFAVGMGLAVLSAWADHRGIVRTATRRLARRAWPWWSGALVLFVMVSTQFGLRTGLDTAGFWPETVRQLFYAAVGLCVVLPSALGDDEGGGIRRALAWGPIAYVGLVSYGIYLWHQAFIRWIPEWAGWPPSSILEPGAPAGLFAGHFWQLAVGSFIGSLAVASISYHVLEKPLMDRFRRGFRAGLHRSRPSAVGAG
jgi:peptidoglycan/LPS O-acetylase OafA/YrhL